jgi:hypothetical protein
MKDLNNILQIESLTGPGTSLSKVLLIFYLAIAGNFTSNLLSKQLRNFFEENRIAQHMIALITLLVLVIAVGGIIDTKVAIIYTIVGYIWFIFTTKLDIQWNIIIILILLIGYLYENSLDNKEKLMASDNALTNDDKRAVISRDNSMKSYIVLAAMAVTIVGTFMYSTKKHVQYGGGYNWLTYMLY